jgi:transcriptional regulator with XRE-family HTH domain
MAEPDITNDTEWAQWMRDLGLQTLRVREFLGLSQDQLARLAGVSQGAVSRLENGRGIATPLLVVARVTSALRQALSQMDPSLLSAEARRVIESGLSLPDVRTPFVAIDPAHDPGVEELLRLYHRLSERHRRQLLVVLRAAAMALANEVEPKSVRGRAD